MVSTKGTNGGASLTKLPINSELLIGCKDSFNLFFFINKTNTLNKLLLNAMKIKQNRTEQNRTC